MLEGFLSVFIPALAIIVILFIGFMVIFRKQLRAMREQEGSIYKRLFGKNKDTEDEDK